MEAVRLARAHGYKNVVRYIVPGGEHTLMPDEVLQYFYSLLSARPSGDRNAMQFLPFVSR